MGINHIARRHPRHRGRGLGFALVALGIGLVLANAVGLTLGGLLWPFYIMAPGLFLFYLVKRMGRGAAFLTVPATMVTAVGGLLLFQNITGLWASWAYAWALIFPASFGMGLAFYGDLARKPSVANVGEGMAKVGLVLFLMGAIFFELLLNLSGIGSWLAGLLIPLMLIGGGIFMLRRKRPPAHRAPSIPRRPTRELPLEHDLLDELFAPEEKTRVRRDRSS